MKKNQKIIIIIIIIILAISLGLIFLSKKKNNANSQEQEIKEINNKNSIKKKKIITKDENVTTNSNSNEKSNNENNSSSSNTMIQKQNSRTSNTGYSNTIKSDVKSNNSNTVETIKNSNVTNTNNNNSNNSNKSDIKKDNVTDNTQNTTADPNDSLRKEIENKYSIKIFYKDEKNNYSAQGYNFNKLYDNDAINQFLRYIDTMLSKYPSGFLKELNNYKQLEIYMVSYISGGAAALTDNLGGSVVITLWCQGYIDNAFHHEMMHYIDCILGTKIDILNSMTPYNPSGFQYGNENNDYTIVDNYNTHYFISSYSKRNYLEDRGVLFADMMTSIYKKSYYNNGEPINEKAKLISDQLKQHFNSITSNSNYWDRYVSR